MLFRRRDPPAVKEKVRVFFVPRRSYRRSFKYFGKRVLRLSASPHAVAAGVAAGTAASFTPFIGFHFILSFVIAFFIRGNMFAAALGTAVGNPLTFPLIWLVTYRVGSSIEGLWRDGAASPLLPEGFTRSILVNGWDAISPILRPMMIGAVPMALITGFGTYLVVRWSLALYQRSRRQRILGNQAIERRNRQPD